MILCKPSSKFDYSWFSIDNFLSIVTQIKWTIFWCQLTLIHRYVHWGECRCFVNFFTEFYSENCFSFHLRLKPSTEKTNFRLPLHPFHFEDVNLAFFPLTTPVKANLEYNIFLSSNHGFSNFDQHCYFVPFLIQIQKVIFSYTQNWAFWVDLIRRFRLFVEFLDSKSFSRRCFLLQLANKFTWEIELQFYKKSWAKILRH